MEFRKIVTITLYVRQQKRHRCIEQSFGLCGRGQGWEDLGEWHWNMYIIICEMNLQSRFEAWYRTLGACALRWPRQLVWGARWEGGSGWGTHVHPWWIHVSSVTQSCPTLCDPMNRSTPGLPVHHQLLEFTQTFLLLDPKAEWFPPASGWSHG